MDKLPFHLLFEWVNDDWMYYTESYQRFRNICHYYGMKSDSNKFDLEGWLICWDGVDPVLPFFITISDSSNDKSIQQEKELINSSNKDNWIKSKKGE